MFRFELTGEGSLRYTNTYELPGNPLSLQVRGGFLIVAVDMPKAALLQVNLQGDPQVITGVYQEDKAEGEEDIALSTDELSKLLFTMENLRKMDFEDGADTEG